ncbi:MAG: alkaline phosphatase family protein, partial [Vicinamibacteraceae bacterium]
MLIGDVTARPPCAAWSQGGSVLHRLAISALVVASALALGELRTGGQTVDPGDAVVLVTLDGARTEEIFGGLDLDVLKSTLKEGQKVEEVPTYRTFWAPTPDERRRKLMPFFWRLVTEDGSIAGNVALGSEASLTNRRLFSYPGYAEILVGQALDSAITSNDPIRNPEETVLEGLRRKRGLSREQVATFASWDVFKAIAEHTEGATTINAGDEPLGIAGAEVALTNRLQHETGSPWDHTRLDAFTVHQAMAYLESARPRILYVALDETDDWAHDGRYDRLLDAYSRTDRWLERLWTWLQAQPDYRGRTHLLITTDHGRGHTPEGWRHHGEKYPEAQGVWMAFVTP